MSKTKINKVDGMLYHELFSKQADIIDERYKCPQKFKRDDDTEEYTFICNSDRVRKTSTTSTMSAVPSPQNRVECESDVVQENEISKRQYIEEGAPGCALRRRRLRS